MIVEIKPEDEELIIEKLRTGAFRSVDDLIHHALVSLNRSQTLSEFLENSPLAGLDLHIDRDPDRGRGIDL